MRHFGWLSIVAVGFSASAFSAQCISYSHGSLYLLINAHTHTHTLKSLPGRVRVNSVSAILSQQCHCGDLWPWWVWAYFLCCVCVYFDV